jgi:hypothetical protein
MAVEPGRQLTITEFAHKAANGELTITCRNRHCPKCQGSQALAWMEERKAELLAVPYFHVVFTLPARIAATAAQSCGCGGSLGARASGSGLGWFTEGFDTLDLKEAKARPHSVSQIHAQPRSLGRRDFQHTRAIAPIGHPSMRGRVVAVVGPGSFPQSSLAITGLGRIVIGRWQLTARGFLNEPAQFGDARCDKYVPRERSHGVPVRRFWRWSRHSARLS